MPSAYTPNDQLPHIMKMVSDGLYLKREDHTQKDLYINGLPLVVFEFKSAIREEATIHDAYVQLTTRYRRDIPELFKHNAFCVISDGVNSKIGSLFTPYEFFCAWRTAERIPHPQPLSQRARGANFTCDGKDGSAESKYSKALFVCSSRRNAFKLYKEIINLRPEWNEKKICEEGATLTEKEKRTTMPLERVKMVMTRGQDDESELYNLIGPDEYRKELDRQFKVNRSNFRIAIVVDMWLTGFDVPALDTLYLDKPVQKHTLIQTISRVNRRFEGKDKGLVVDYIGIKSQMDEAINQYGAGGEEGSGEGVEGVNQSIIFKLTLKDTPDIAIMNAKVQAMIEEALKSNGVEEVIKLCDNDGELSYSPKTGQHVKI